VAGGPSYTCGEITNAFYTLTGQVSPRLYNKVAPVDPWIAKTPRGEWPEGLGYVINNMMLERTTTDAETGTEWVAAAPSALTGETGGPFNNCLPTPEILKFGQTLRPMQIFRRNIQTDDFCINDLAADFQIEKVLNNMMDILGFITEWVWSNRAQNEYMRLCDHQLTETGSSFDLFATAWDATKPPTSRLLVGTLEQIYQQLVLEGAHQGGAVGYSTGNDMPVFDLFSDANTSRDLVRQDPDLRMDFRYANPSQLTQQIGTPFSYQGFHYSWIKYPPRWEIVGGAYQRIYPWTAPIQTTKGYKRQINPAYTYATYQTSFVFIPTVYTQLMERPSTNPGGRVKFDYASHMGEFQFLVIKDKKCNPRGETGFFDAIYASASEPGHTELGYAIMHLNCPPLRLPKPSCYS
jgi:hypothetical protein